eukprot:scaffold32283_cov132-Skeletonema_dohrnii-CCMP3373.AAC.2
MRLCGSAVSLKYIVMPSKKKTSRGRARKGRNNRKKKNEGGEQQGPLDTQMERLNIGDDSESEALDEAIKLAAAEKEEALESRAAEEEKSFTMKTSQVSTMQCYHGFVPGEDHFIIDNFGKTFLSRVNSPITGNVGECINLAYQATRKIYPEVGNDYCKMKLVLSLYLFQGTQAVIEGYFDDARFFAAVAFYLEDYITFYFEDGANDVFDAARQIELLSADQHTLVKYLRKKIPCCCLDEKYKQVKSITKLGICCNEKCSIPDRLVERRSMFYCTRCRAVNYCSRECQKAAWPTHKSYCDKHSKARTGLDSRK